MATVRFTSSPATPFYAPSHEARYYPVRGGSVTLHSHISGSPFLGYPQSTQGISIDIYQHPNCRVRSVSVSVDPYASLAKAMLRLRIAVITWCTGWVATILFLQLSQYACNGGCLALLPLTAGSLPSFSDVVDEHGVRLTLLAVGLSAVALVIQQVGSGLGLPTGRLFVGLTRVTYLPLMLLAAAWSGGTVALVHILQQASLKLLGRVLQPAQE